MRGARLGRGGRRTASEESEGKKRRVTLSAVWRESRDLIWTHRRRLAAGLVLLLVSRLAGMVLPASTKFLIDEVIAKGRTELLYWLAGGAAVATLIQGATAFGLAYLVGVAGQRAIFDLRLRVQAHVIRLPVAYFERHKTGELISRVMNDAEGIRNLIGTGLLQLVGGLVTAAVAFGVLLWLNWRLTLITAAAMILFAAVFAVGFTRLRPIFRARNRLMADVTGRLTESLSGVRVVKAYTAEEREAGVFAERSRELLNMVIRSLLGVASITSLATVIIGLLGVAVALLGVREVLEGRMTVGDILMFVIFTGLMVTPIVQIGAIGTQITEAFAGLDRIREVISEPTEEAEDGDKEPLGRVEGEVVFEGVDFAYEPDLPVLRGVSFRAPAGTTTALVGRSGAGKSTVISLVLAFRRPQEGRILVDGRDLAGVKLEDYRSQLAVVLQDDFLFDGTIAENIAYSRSDAPREEIEEAGRLARCGEFVEGFPEGYDTVIGERGVKLSGGQKQRVTIARAILADPRILILDEATSSLDTESEQAIQEGLEALKAGRTTFVIAHRLSTIRNAEQILVLERGEIVERGSHRELLEAGGLYREFYQRQARFEGDLYLNPGETVREEEEEDQSEAKRPRRDAGFFGRAESLLDRDDDDR